MVTLVYLTIVAVLIQPALVIMVAWRAGLLKNAAVWVKIAGFAGVFAASAFVGLMIVRHAIEVLGIIPYVTLVLVFVYFYLWLWNNKMNTKD